jgi:hypothetical protein
LGLSLALLEALVFYDRAGVSQVGEPAETVRIPAGKYKEGRARPCPGGLYRIATTLDQNARVHGSR